MVYISTPAMMTSMRLSIMSQQQQIADAQAELASGTYADIGISLGEQSGRLLSLTGEQTRLQAYTKGNTIASTRLNAISQVLTNLQSTATSFLASLSTSTTAGNSPATLKQTAADSLTALISALNTTVGGEAVFGGINSSATPMTVYASNPSSAPKQAVDDAFTSTFSTSQTSAGTATITAAQISTFLNGSFAGLFSSGSYGGTWSAASSQPQTTQISNAQTVDTSVTANDATFRDLAQAFTMVSEFTGSSFSADAQQAVAQSAVALMTTAVQGLTDMQTQIGFAQTSISDANDRITAQSGVLTTATQDLSSVDPVALNSKIASLQTQIEASYELTSSLQKLSLVNYFTA